MTVSALNNRTNSKTDSSEKDWGTAVDEAERVGIRWERPEGDDRSAKDIINDDPLLKNLDNREKARDMLKEQVGDFTKDADAAYRATQVLEHIETFNANGDRQAGKDVGNGRIDGYTSQSHAKHGTEAGRLKDFGKEGFSNLKGVLNPEASVGDDKKAREAAEAVGIEWELPEGDKRSAQDILDDDPLLKNLGNQSDVKKMLKERVGDFEKDANAAHRASQVLRHIERFDKDGNRVAGKTIDDGKINGFTKSGEAKPNTEAGRLQDFGKYGFENLKGKLGEHATAGDDKQARQEAEKLGIQWERPEGDTRSAERILKDNPLLANLGNQSGVRDMLKDRVGDFEKDADAAFRAVQVLQHVEQLDGDGKRIAGEHVGNGKIDEFTKDKEARPNTEAGRLQDFGKHGFSALKGSLVNRAEVGNDKQAREAAEKAGIVWERPEDDKRSAKEILNDHPLLAGLGNQSGVKDMLKDRVGDYEKDADAAFRAVQVLDRVTMFDENGKAITDKHAFDNDINGFRRSGEADHGTEAGRLQDFGKEGFSVLPALKKTDDISSYKDYLKANPDADDASKLVTKYSAVLLDNYDAIVGKTDSGKYLTADALQEYKEKNTHLSDEVKDALDFWSQPGAFEMLDTAKHSLAQRPDGDVSKGDLQSWIKDSAPKDAQSLMGMLSEVADRNLLSKIDTSKFDKDIFENPDKYSAEDKAAVLYELMNAQSLIINGGSAGMWRDDKSKVTIANKVRSHPDPKELLDDVNKHIALLQSDQEVAKYLDEQGTKALQEVVNDNVGLKAALEDTYKNDIKTGQVLDDLWSAKAKDGDVKQQEVLAEFAGTASQYQRALGIDKPADMQEAVKNSSHKGELEDFYKDWLVSGDRMTQLLASSSVEEATSAFSMEVALYNAMLDPEVTAKHDAKLEENFTKIAQENAFKDATFEDLKKAFGVDGGDELDEEKVEALVEEVRSSNPELLVNQDGTVATGQTVLASVRGYWDLLRQGTKTLDKLNLFDKGAKLDGFLKNTSDRGVMHGVSGVFMAGLTIARGAEAKGKLTDKQIVDITTGSVQAATLLTEGGSKAFQKYLKDAGPKLEAASRTRPGDSAIKQALKLSLSSTTDLQKSLTNVAKTFEDSAKGLGGMAGIAMGAYGIFDGVQAIRKGDKLGGGMGITASSFGLMAGLATTAEAGASLTGLAGSSSARVAAIAARLPAVAGGLGFVAAGVGIIAAIVPAIVNEVKQENRVGKFADLLSDHLTKYEIDGVENGDYFDVPDDAWPEDTSSIA